jgi:hypothetical protein
MEQATSTTPLDFCTRADDRIAQVRNEAVRTAFRTLMSGMDGRLELASASLYSSVLYQARLSGVRV